MAADDHFISKPVSPSIQEQIQALFVNDYSKGIDAFLETSWYSSKGSPMLANDDNCCRIFQDYIEKLREIKSEDYDGLRRLPGQEARVIWALMCLARTAALQSANNESNSSYDKQLNEVTRRLAIFESLITGQVMDSNPLAHTQAPTGVAKDAKYFEVEFWRLLGRFISIKDDFDNASELDHTLTSLRQILQQCENRDVLYSMAIVRHVDNRRDAQLTTVQRLEEDENRKKVMVAKAFIEEEAAGKGTTQVIQRLCGMAARGWMVLRENGSVERAST